MKRTLALIAGLALAPGTAGAVPLFGLDVGDSVRTATVALADAAPAAWSAQAPQALRRGLVETGLLEALNRSGAGERGADGALDPEGFARFVTARGEGVAYTLAFSRGGELRYLLARAAVRLGSSDPFVAQRLAPLRAELDRLSRRHRLRAVERDEYGNRLQWAGRTRRGALWVRWVPESDELWLLVHPGGR